MAGVAMMRSHTIHRHQHHFGWDNSIPPLLTVGPGDEVSLEPVDGSGGQVRRDGGPEQLAGFDREKANPVCGPIYIDGAAPGDAVKIAIKGIDVSAWGWTGIVPGNGLLAGQFRDPALTIWTCDSQTGAAISTHCRVPLRPFPGTIGLAPAEPGRHSIRPPRRVGGNMDTRDLVEGAELYLPVEVCGGLFSLGDTHAAQGDGEVCGTAIEISAKVTVGFQLIKGAHLAFPRFDTPGPVTRHVDQHGYHVTTGVGPDLMEDARAAVSGMIDLLTARHGLPAVDAYMLCSVCGDLRINEIVDRPNWVVSFYFPRCIFD